MPHTETMPKDDGLRVLFLPPTRRDRDVLVRLFERANLSYLVCQDIKALSVEIDRDVGVLLLTDGAFAHREVEELWSALARQPSWSEVPSIVLCESGSQSMAVTRCVQNLRNVTVLEKPTSSRTLISAIQAGLRARARQYQMRDQLLALQTSEAALLTATRQLTDSNRRKDEFLAMLAHELRNPLAPIMNASEIMARLVTEPQLQATVRLLKRQTAHLTRLVDDLLDLSRITSGRIELRREPLDIAAVVSQALEIAEPLMREKDHTFLVATGYERMFVRGDHARLVQSIANLLNNAAKYTDSGGEIRLEVQKQEDDVVIIISDNGIGIAPDLLPLIFDLFVQADHSLDRSQGGLGIGLSVVKRLIEMHKGKVLAESDGSGRGSTFKVRLPLIEAPASSEVTHARPRAAPKRVLIVDDNADAANSLATVLELEGHQVEAVYSAEKALSTATAMQPDVIVLDIGLPAMNGYEVATLLRPVLSSTQLIALTGYGQREDVLRAKEAGFDAHFVKPVDVPSLTQLISDFSKTK